MSDPIFQLTVEADIAEVARYLTDLERQQLPYATSVALNRTAWQIRKDIQADMRRIFHKPTAFSLNQVNYRKTNKRDLRSSVDITPPGLGKSHLQVHIEGGVRSLKRSEQQLRMTNVLPAGRYTVPSTRLLNAAGNISGPRIVQILSGVRGFSQRGYLANVTDRSRKRNPSRAQYFVAAPDRPRTRHLKPGIYERTTKKPRPALLFTRPPVYRKIFPFHSLCAAHARRIFPTEMRTAIAKAIATAK